MLENMALLQDLTSRADPVITPLFSFQETFCILAGFECCLPGGRTQVLNREKASQGQNSGQSQSGS